MNQFVRETLGGLHSISAILHSFDFAEIERLQHEGQWERLASELIHVACQLERDGADCIIICTNTMHRLADEVQAAINVPLLHIADATADAILAARIRRVGLLGTRFTMEGEFYKGRFSAHGIETIVPDETARELVHHVIYDELCAGEVMETSREAILRMIEDLTAKGAEGIVLGCTELPLLITQEHTRVKVFDTTALHARAAVRRALAL